MGLFRSVLLASSSARGVAISRSALTGECCLLCCGCQESASDFWRRRLFFMARDRLAHILPPMAVVLAASVFVTLLYMGTLKPDMHLPIQIPMTVLAWARLVLAVQIIKVRSSVSC